MAAGLAEITEMAVGRWRAELDHDLPIIERIITQIRRRVLDGEVVPAGEKLVSLFEPHADIIVKSLPRRRPGVGVRFSTDTSSIWRPARAG
jgi:transposase, IS5 family